MIGRAEGCCHECGAVYEYEIGRHPHSTCFACLYELLKGDRLLAADVCEQIGSHYDDISDGFTKLRGIVELIGKHTRSTKIRQLLSELDGALRNVLRKVEIACAQGDDLETEEP